ncbi:MAG TPA: hypothetical protein VGG29_17430 [Caulobacteraceae bacterium]
MAGFSAADAAFTGFRVVWARPWVVAIWAAVQLVANFAVNLFLAASAGPVIARMSAEGASGQPPDPNLVLGLIRQAAPTYVAIMIAVLVLTAVFWAAMNRAVMRPADARFGYLRLASDELRQLGLLAALVGLLACFYAVLLLAGSLLAVLFGMFAGAAGAGMALAAVVAALLVGLVYFAVRFSLASALTFATGRINVLGSWTLTHNRFWPLFATYLIAMALSFFVVVLMLAIAMAAVGLMGGMTAVIALFHEDGSSVAAMLAPTWLVYLAVTSIGAALSAPITLCPPASIYQSLSGGAGAVSRVFD